MAEDAQGLDLQCQPWWDSRPALQRFVADLIEDELARLRRATGGLPRPWPDDLALDRDLGVDSLELMALATSLAESLHLHESGIEDYLLARRSLGQWVDIAQAGLARFSRTLTFRTSGSSGVPKACNHSLASLCQETEELAAMFSGRARLLCAVPAHHLYGFLFTLLLPRALGLASGAVIDLRASTPAWLARNARPGDLVVGHPEFWDAVARTVPRLPADVIGVTSTAHCADAICASLEQAGIARLFQIYGSSETAGIGWRASHREPYRLFSYWSSPAEQPGELLRQLPGGAQLTARCQDRLDWLSQRTFLVAGRHDAAVQVGGVNVFPSHVASVLRRHPQVLDAAVRLMRPEEGTRLKAYVVPTSDVVDPSVFLAGLRSWIDQQLPVPERPKAIQCGDRLPVSASGKSRDWPLDAQDAGEPRHHG